MQYTRLRSKGQVTVPPEVRARLRLRPGDTLSFEVEGDEVRVRKAGPIDRAGYGAPFAEWDSAADNEAFRDL